VLKVGPKNASEKKRKWFQKAANNVGTVGSDMFIGSFTAEFVPRTVWSTADRRFHMYGPGKVELVPAKVEYDQGPADFTVRYNDKDIGTVHATARDLTTNIPQGDIHVHLPQAYLRGPMGGRRLGAGTCLYVWGGKAAEQVDAVVDFLAYFEHTRVKVAGNARAEDEEEEEEDGDDDSDDGDGSETSSDSSDSTGDGGSDSDDGDDNDTREEEEEDEAEVGIAHAQYVSVFYEQERLRVPFTRASATARSDDYVGTTVDGRRTGKGTDVLRTGSSDVCVDRGVFVEDRLYKGWRSKRVYSQGPASLTFEYVFAFRPVMRLVLEQTDVNTTPVFRDPTGEDRGATDPTTCTLLADCTRLCDALRRGVPAADFKVAKLQQLGHGQSALDDASNGTRATYQHPAYRRHVIYVYLDSTQPQTVGAVFLGSVSTAAGSVIDERLSGRVLRRFSCTVSKNIVPLVPSIDALDEDQIQATTKLVRPFQTAVEKLAQKDETVGETESIVRARTMSYVKANAKRLAPLLARTSSTKKPAKGFANGVAATLAALVTQTDTDVETIPLFRAIRELVKLARTHDDDNRAEMPDVIWNLFRTDVLFAIVGAGRVTRAASRLWSYLDKFGHRPSLTTQVGECVSAAQKLFDVKVHATCQKTALDVDDDHVYWAEETSTESGMAQVLKRALGPAESTEAWEIVRHLCRFIAQEADADVGQELYVNEEDTSSALFATQQTSPLVFGTGFAFSRQGMRVGNLLFGWAHGPGLAEDSHGVKARRQVSSMQADVMRLNGVPQGVAEALSAHTHDDLSSWLASECAHLGDTLRQKVKSILESKPKQRKDMSAFKDHDLLARKLYAYGWVCAGKDCDGLGAESMQERMCGRPLLEPAALFCRARALLDRVRKAAAVYKAAVDVQSEKELMQQLERWNDKSESDTSRPSASTSRGRVTWHITGRPRRAKDIDASVRDAEESDLWFAVGDAYLAAQMQAVYVRAMRTLGKRTYARARLDFVTGTMFSQWLEAHSAACVKTVTVEDMSEMLANGNDKECTTGTRASWFPSIIFWAVGVGKLLKVRQNEATTLAQRLNEFVYPNSKEPIDMAVYARRVAAIRRGAARRTTGGKTQGGGASEQGAGTDAASGLEVVDERMTRSVNAITEQLKALIVKYDLKDWVVECESFDDAFRVTTDEMRAGLLHGFLTAEHRSNESGESGESAFGAANLGMHVIRGDSDFGANTRVAERVQRVLTTFDKDVCAATAAFRLHALAECEAALGLAGGAGASKAPICRVDLGLINRAAQDTAKCHAVTVLVALEACVPPALLQKGPDLREKDAKWSEGRRFSRLVCARDHAFLQVLAKLTQTFPSVQSAGEFAAVRAAAEATAMVARARCYGSPVPDALRPCLESADASLVYLALCSNESRRSGPRLFDLHEEQRKAAVARALKAAAVVDAQTAVNKFAEAVDKDLQTQRARKGPNAALHAVEGLADEAFTADAEPRDDDLETNFLAVRTALRANEGLGQTLLDVLAADGELKVAHNGTFLGIIGTASTTVSAAGQEAKFEANAAKAILAAAKLGAKPNDVSLVTKYKQELARQSLRLVTEKYLTEGEASDANDARAKEIAQQLAVKIHAARKGVVRLADLAVRALDSRHDALDGAHEWESALESAQVAAGLKQVSISAGGKRAVRRRAADAAKAAAEAATAAAEAATAAAEAATAAAAKAAADAATAAADVAAKSAAAATAIAAEDTAAKAAAHAATAAAAKAAADAAKAAADAAAKAATEAAAKAATEAAAKAATEAAAEQATASQGAVAETTEETAVDHAKVKHAPATRPEPPLGVVTLDATDVDAGTPPPADRGDTKRAAVQATNEGKVEEQVEEEGKVEEQVKEEGEGAAVNLLKVLSVCGACEPPDAKAVSMPQQVDAFMKDMDDIKACVADSFRRNSVRDQQPDNVETVQSQRARDVRTECCNLLGVYGDGGKLKPNTPAPAPGKEPDCKLVLEGGHEGLFVYAQCSIQPSVQPAHGPESNQGGAAPLVCKGSVLFRQAIPQQRSEARSEDQGHTRIWYDLTGLRPNAKHGVHIHESGCDNHDCGSTGGHWNPHGRTHGDVSDAPNCHAGDLGNVQADQQGRARGTLVSSLVHLFGPYTVVGRSVVVHADQDDLGRGDSSEPGTNGKTSHTTGNSGARIACGQILPTARTLVQHLHPDA
jgi:Cu/Zn superoxide dismutase